MGTFEDARAKVAAETQVIAAANASPEQFANMVCDAYDLGRVIATGSFGIMAIANTYQKPGRYAKVDIEDEKLVFFTWRGANLFGEPSEPIGVYRNVFSVCEHSLDCHELVESPTDDHAP